MKKNIKWRIRYTLLTIFLLITEILIALYVHDSFVRPYIGDVLVVIVIYTFIRIWIPEKCRSLPLWVFLFAAAVEILQYFKLVELLGMQGNAFLRILLGSVFDIKDILCYAVGCILLSVYELLRERKKE